jgi:hypothetical protein
VKRLGCYIGSVPPRDRATVDEEAGKVSRSLERLEDRTFEPIGEVDSADDPVTEREPDPELAPLLCADNYG